MRKTVQAHAYWRHKGLRADLIIWTDAYAGYRQSLLDEVIGLLNASTEAKMLDQPGGIFVRSTDQLPEEDRVLFQAVARVVLTDRAGTLADQVRRRPRTQPPQPRLAPSRSPEPVRPSELALPRRELLYFNGLGGFTPDGREYVVTLAPDAHTPAPWVNVLANAQFGTVVSESGQAYTWSENAHEFRLTPWYNDPVTDRSGEAFYIRDEESGRFWSPAPAPARGQTPYVCRHGLGYSAFEHTEQGIFTETMVYVAIDAPVKFTVITLRNASGRDRRVSVTGYCEWVLGELRDHAAMHVVSMLDPQSRALFASNGFSYDFPGRIAFFQCSEEDRTYTSDRTEFLGRHGQRAAPYSLTRRRLSNRVTAGADPCAAIQAYVDLPAGQSRQVVFILARRRAPARRGGWCIASGGPAVRGRPSKPSGKCGSGCWAACMWRRRTSRWTFWSITGCRIRCSARDSGGAAATTSRAVRSGSATSCRMRWPFSTSVPGSIRGHLLTAAGRQFREGDAQHWWHPPTGRGVRTRCSDDYLWLCLAVCRYVHTTGDTGVLEVSIPFLESRQLGPEEESNYARPAVSDQRGTLYEHCVRAIRHAIHWGSHGLPLIGFGDWNDGLNHVGRAGRGESVWLAFFLIHVLDQFAALCAGGTTMRWHANVRSGAINCGRTSRPTRGTGSGIVGPISMTASRSGPRRTRNVRSMCCPRRGRRWLGAWIPCASRPRCKRRRTAWSIRPWA